MQRFSKRALSEVQLNAAILTNAVLVEVNASHAFMLEAILTGANFNDAFLRGAIMPDGSEYIPESIKDDTYFK